MCLVCIFPVTCDGAQPSCASQLGRHLFPTWQQGPCRFCVLAFLLLLKLGRELPEGRARASCLLCHLRQSVAPKSLGLAGRGRTCLCDQPEPQAPHL